MSKDIGEDLVGAWLREVERCDFVQYNVPLRDQQGEIDVIGLNLLTRTVYICEVATHTTQGLQYTYGNRPNNVEKLTSKFQADVDYSRKYLAQFENHRFMLWSPIVRHSADDAKHNQFADLVAIRRNLYASHRADVEMIVNEVYLQCVEQLRARAAKETAASEYPVFRLLQILQKLEKHVAKLQKRGISTRALLKETQLE